MMQSPAASRHVGRLGNVYWLWQRLPLTLMAVAVCCSAGSCYVQLQSVQLPFALIPVLAFNASAALMGKFVNGKGMIAVTVAISLVVMVINVSGVMAFFEAALSGADMWVWGAVAVAVALYLMFVGYLFLHATAAAGLLPPILGFVAHQPGGASRDSVGGGVFVQLPYESDDSSETGEDEEAGPNVIRALASPSSSGAVAAGSAAAVVVVDAGAGQREADLGSSAGSSSAGSSSSIAHGAWLAAGRGTAAAAPSGAAVCPDGYQQPLLQPLLPQAGADMQGRRH